MILVHFFMLNFTKCVEHNIYYTNVGLSLEKKTWLVRFEWHLLFILFYLFVSGSYNNFKSKVSRPYTIIFFDIKQKMYTNYLENKKWFWYSWKYLELINNIFIYGCNLRFLAVPNFGILRA